jgi:FHS family L-fucose permease-like MFS transporter
LPNDNNHLTRLLALSAIYLVWGAIASLNDLLIPYLKSEFALSYGQASRVQLVFYAAYFFLSLPCGYLSRRFGYRKGIFIGLAAAISGCLLMMAAPLGGKYGFFLAALFVLAAGITMLQVAANPYVTSLGPERTAASRLTLVQSFHSLGTTIGPYLGAILIFSTVAVAAGEVIPALDHGGAVVVPYALLALLLGVLAFLFRFLDTGNVAVAGPAGTFGAVALLKAHPRLLLGTLGIFFYVGAEIAIGSFLVNYMGDGRISGLEPETAGKFVSVYWGCALLGRFAGSLILRYVPAGRLLVFYALMAATLVFTSITSTGLLAMWSILLVGFFNSIMFPTIFALTIRDFRHEAHAASGILCLGIVGGAVISQLQGVLADYAGIQASFSLPMFCYLYIAIFAFLAFVKKRGIRRTQ